MEGRRRSWWNIFLQSSVSAVTLCLAIAGAPRVMYDYSLELQRVYLMSSRRPQLPAAVSQLCGGPPRMCNRMWESAANGTRVADIHQESSILVAQNGVLAHGGDDCQSAMGHCVQMAELCHTRLSCVEVCRARPPGGGGLPLVPGSWSCASSSIHPFWRWKYTGRGRRPVDCRANSELDSVTADLHRQAV